MPLCNPADPFFGDGAQAERAVWDVLREQLPPEAALFYSVRFMDGSRSQVIDLLVAWPEVGIAAIQVTGGIVKREASGWVEGTGELKHPVDPLTNPDDEHHLLGRMLVERRSPAARARTVHMVALPHTPVPPDYDSEDLPRGLLLDRDDLADAAGLVRAAILEYGRPDAGSYGHGDRPLSQQGLRSLVDLLTAQMPSQVENLAAACDDESRLGHLTRDQAKVLDLAEHYPRLIVTGGAGSGKTWLALELARRMAQADARVGILCRSRGLVRYLQRVTEQWPARQRPAYVGTPQDLLSLWADLPERPAGAAESEYWDVTLPDALRAVAIRRPDVEQFDALVVDEAQVFGAHWWPALTECLREPQTGALLVFTDNGYSLELERAGVPIDVAPQVLSENLRSTRQIARLTEGFALEEFLPRGRKRAAVRFVDVPLDYASAIAEAAVEALVAEGWAPGSIARLTTAPSESDEPEPEQSAASWDVVLEGRDVYRGSVTDFQGLERAVVVLAVNGFSDPGSARQLLYSGLSRARSLLVVVSPGDVIADVGGERVRKRLRKAERWSPT